MGRVTSQPNEPVHRCPQCNTPTYYESVCCRICEQALDEARRAWVQFAAAAFPKAEHLHPNERAELCGKAADLMLIEYHVRWPLPEKKEP